MNNWIVINGSPIDGFTYHGPFSTAQEASGYGHNHFDESGFFITQLTKEQGE